MQRISLKMNEVDMTLIASKVDFRQVSRMVPFPDFDLRAE
jgi:hypothetical protein